MEKREHMRCYFVGEIQHLQMHSIVTSTKLCVLTELDLITWPKNFAVRKPHTYCKIGAVTNFEVGVEMKGIGSLYDLQNLVHDLEE